LVGEDKLNTLKSRPFFLLFTIVIILVLLFGNIVSTLEPKAMAAEEPTEISLAGLPSKGNPKLDSALNSVLSAKTSASKELLIAQEDFYIDEDTVRIIIESITGYSDEISAIVNALGIIEGSYGDYIQMVVPVSCLLEISEFEAVKQVRTPMQPLPDIISEGVPLINADGWQTAGYDGAGVKIGVLDVGFDGYITRQVEGELPASITTWWAPSIGNQGTEVHGAACAEIVYDIAPAAFTTSSLEISPDEVDIGEDVSITVSVDNTDETEGVCQLVCKVNGVVVDEKEITLAGGSRETVVFTTTFNEAGNKTIEVNELSGSLGVKEAVEEEPSPDPGTIAEIPTQETPEEPAPESRWWIAGPVVGVCAVIAAFVIYLVRRKRIQNMI